MVKKSVDNDAPVNFFKDETARLRWEMFHRAIAHAKQSNLEAIDDNDTPGSDSENSGPLLSIVR